MQIDKQQIIDMIRSKGDPQKTEQAQQELPDQVDPDQHADLLAKHGVDPKEVMGNPAGLGDKLGG